MSNYDTLILERTSFQYVHFNGNTQNKSSPYKRESLYLEKWIKQLKKHNNMLHI